MRRWTRRCSSNNLKTTWFTPFQMTRSPSSSKANLSIKRLRLIGLTTNDPVKRRPTLYSIISKIQSFLRFWTSTTMAARLRSLTTTLQAITITRANRYQWSDQEIKMTKARWWARLAKSLIHFHYQTSMRIRSTNSTKTKISLHRVRVEGMAKDCHTIAIFLATRRLRWLLTFQ